MPSLLRCSLIAASQQKHKKNPLVPMVQISRKIRRKENIKMIHSVPDIFCQIFGVSRDFYFDISHTFCGWIGGGLLWLYFQQPFLGLRGWNWRSPGYFCKGLFKVGYNHCRVIPLFTRVFRPTGELLFSLINWLYCYFPRDKTRTGSNGVGENVKNDNLL